MFEGIKTKMKGFGGNFGGRTSNHVAASRGRRAMSMPTKKTSPNTALNYELKLIQERSRDAVRNRAFDKNAIRKLVSHEIGSGIKPKFCIEDEEINKAVTELWEKSCKELVGEGIGNFYAGQTLISRGRNESGEVFIRRRRRPSSSNLAVPMQIQIIESEFLDSTYDKTLDNGNIIRAGIELNRRGDRVAYWFFKTHPNDKTIFGNDSNERVRILARDVIHHYIPLRAGQLRGAPINTASLFKSANLDQYDDFELERKKNHASFTGTIEKDAYRDTDGRLLDITGEPYPDDVEVPSVGLDSGVIVELADGERLNLANAETGGEFYVDYMRQQLRTIAADYGIMYEVVTGDWSQLNDRLFRAASDDFKRHMSAIQEIYMISQVCEVVQGWWIDAIVASGRLSLPNFAQDRDQYMACDWIPQGWTYVHPLQDAQAAEKLIELGITTRDKEARKHSMDAAKVQDENIKYRARQAELEAEQGLTNEQDETDGEDLDETDEDSDTDIQRSTPSR